MYVCVGGVGGGVVRIVSITSSFMVGFQNFLVDPNIMTKQYIACKNHVASLKVKVTLCAKT